MVDDKALQDILNEYDSQRAIYSEFTAKVEDLLKEILALHNIKTHSITSRIKDRASLIAKMNKPDSDYTTLSDITDISGARVITYFADEVDIIAPIIEKEFTIDVDNSIDKRKLLDPDRFGYLSLHYVVSLRPERTQLPEYQRFSNMKAEVQIRSILQHAWAEIEHDHGYKNATAIPSSVRRQFSRLAGLLELGDEEFMKIRKDLENYTNKLPESIANIPENVSLDRASIIAFVNANTTIKQLDRYIANLCNASLQPISNAWADRHVNYLNQFGIRSIMELDSAIRTNSDLIKKFSSYWFKDYRTLSFSTGISIFYLDYLLLAGTLDKENIALFLTTNKIGTKGERTALARRLLDTYKMSQSAT